MMFDDEKESYELDKKMAEIVGKPFRKPGHGPCCTCQYCGYHYDDCDGECHYSSDENASSLVVRAMIEDAYIYTCRGGMMPGGSELWDVEFHCSYGPCRRHGRPEKMAGHGGRSESISSRAMAECVAALRAKETERGE